MEQASVVVVHQQAEVVARVARAIECMRDPPRVYLGSRSADAVRLVHRHRPHVLVLGMRFDTGSSGGELLDRIRAKPAWDVVAILVVTSSLDAGRLYVATLQAEACLPLASLTEEAVQENVAALLAHATRLRCVVRRAGKLRVHPGRRVAWCARRPLDLTPVEYDILEQLVTAPLDCHGYDALRAGNASRMRGGGGDRSRSKCAGSAGSCAATRT